MSYNSNVILQKIHAIQQRRRETTSSPAVSSLLNRTSQGFKEVIEYGAHLLTASNETLMSSDFRLTLKRYTKGSTASIYSRELVEFDLNQTQIYQNARNKRNKLLETVAAKSGVITVEMVRFNKRKREDDDVKKTKHAVETTQKKLQKEQDKREKQRLKL